MNGLRPYAAAFAARFQLMLQYRAAALAGFATQCWWGLIKVMVLAAFYGGAHGPQPLTLRQVVTYVWLGQAFLALQAWGGDPEIAEAVRSGAVAYDRLRPVDTYAWWYGRAAAWMTARALPRAALMFLAAGVVPLLIGLEQWGLPLPAGWAAAGFFAISLVALVALSSALIMLINITVAATMNERGANTLFTPLIIILSGNLIPLPLFPGWMHTFLLIQPFAGQADIPFRIYSGALVGWDAAAGIGLQLGWTVALVLLGRWLAGLTFRRLQVQGG